MSAVGEGRWLVGHAGLQAERCAWGGDIEGWGGGGDVARERVKCCWGDGDTISFSTVLEKKGDKNNATTAKKT